MSTGSNSVNKTNVNNNVNGNQECQNQVSKSAKGVNMKQNNVNSQQQTSPVGNSVNEKT